MKLTTVLPPLAITLLLASAAAAAPVTVRWDPNPPEENVTGYVVHWGAASRVYGSQLDVGNATEVTVDLPDNAYVAVTAYNAAGLSSDYSAEVQVGAAPSVPTSPPAPGVTRTVVDGLGRSVTVTVTISGGGL